MAAPFNWNFTETGGLTPNRTTLAAGGMTPERNTSENAEQRARAAEAADLYAAIEEACETCNTKTLDQLFYGDDPEDRIATIITMLKFNTALTAVIAAFMTTAFAVAVTLVLMLG